MTHVGGTVHAFRLLLSSQPKATDHELQKHDIFTRYGHARAGNLGAQKSIPR
jgi:hypothetical protein